MFNDNLPVNPTWENCSFCLILYITMVFMAKKQSPPYYNQRINIHVGWFLIFVFFIFSFFNDDWFAYFDHVKNAHYIIGNINNLSNREAMEAIYYYIAFALDGDYLLWRFFVFGITVLLSYLICKRLGVNQASFFYSFVLIATPILSYARASLAMAIGFCGLTFLSSPLPSKKILSYLFGCLLIVISVLFHKSALALPIITYIAYSFRVTRAKLILLIIFILGAFLLLDTTEIIYMLFGNDDIQYFVSGKSTKYLIAEVHNEGIGQLTIKLLFWTSYYLFAFISIVIIWKDKMTNKNLLPFLNSVVIIILFASIFLFIRNANTHMLFYRFLNYASIPIAVVVAYCINKGIYRQAFVRITYLCVLSHILSILYSTYSSYIHY